MAKKRFDHKKIEDKWKKHWYDNNIYKAENFSEKPKKYILAEFPYPSGKSMHMGHMMRFTVPDTYSRFLRMSGYNVLYPMGWDAFGLPAENFAIKTGRHPSEKIEELKVFYKNSMQDIGYGIDWDREVNTTDPEYYKWTQWIFLKFFEAGLAEFKDEPVWWCEEMKTVLAEEEVIKDANGNLVSERGEHPVERRMFKQWVLKITQYADKLVEGLDSVDFPQSIKSAQSNWIGRKEGINIDYKVDGSDEVVTCFTTTPVNWGATFIVVAPEHPVIEKITTKEQEKEVQEYVEKAKQKTDLERMTEEKVKTGAFTGSYAINHVNGEKIPIWVADFVLMSVGTGAVQGCPAHDERDWDFAKKFGIPIVRVVEGEDGETSPEIDKLDPVKTGKGVTRPMVNSDFLNGIPFDEAMQKTMDYFQEQGWGKRIVVYSIRDWLFSRQRYWGEPIPLIHKQDGSVEGVAITTDPESVSKNLPVLLPELPNYAPTDGVSPLERDLDWVNTVDSEGNPAKREVNTMPNWAGSSWYYIRYTDPKNSEAPADMEKMKYWLPVDQYFGGAEHTTQHLLYSRFWHKFLYDQGVVPTPEPYQWRMNGGTLLGPDGVRMSKSRGNVIEPKEKIEEYGADAVRMYISFIGPYDGTFAYSETGLKACRRVIDTIFEVKEKVSADAQDPELEKKLHRMLRKISGMFADLRINTVISEYMIFVKELKSAEKIPAEVWTAFIKAISPVMVFTAEELWQEHIGAEGWESEKSVHLQSWPEYNEELIKEDFVEIPVQVNGKLRGSVVADVGVSQEEVVKSAMEIEKVKRALEGLKVQKEIYVSGKILNIVAS